MDCQSWNSLQPVLRGCIAVARCRRRDPLVEGTPMDTASRREDDVVRLVDGLRDLGREPRGLVLAVRRLERRPPLVQLGARVLADLGDQEHKRTLGLKLEDFIGAVQRYERCEWTKGFSELHASIDHIFHSEKDRICED